MQCIHTLINHTIMVYFIVGKLCPPPVPVPGPGKYRTPYIHEDEVDRVLLAFEDCKVTLNHDDKLPVGSVCKLYQDKSGSIFAILYININHPNARTLHSDLCTNVIKGLSMEYDSSSESVMAEIDGRLKLVKVRSKYIKPRGISLMTKQAIPGSRIVKFGKSGTHFVSQSGHREIYKMSNLSTQPTAEQKQETIKEATKTDESKIDPVEYAKYKAFYADKMKESNSKALEMVKAFVEKCQKYPSHFKPETLKAVDEELTKRGDIHMDHTMVQVVAGFNGTFDQLLAEAEAANKTAEKMSLAEAAGAKSANPVARSQAIQRTDNNEAALRSVLDGLYTKRQHMDDSV